MSIDDTIERVASTPPNAPPPTKSERAYLFLHEQIASGRYVPGYRLVLGDIAHELGISIAPVREAIRRLDADGLVTLERNVGAQVALIEETEYLHTMQTLALVEGFATALSAPLLAPDRIDAARAINDHMRKRVDGRAAGDFDPHEFTALNQQFHAVLFEPCPNPHVLELVHRGWARMARLRDSSFGFAPGRAEGSVVEHDEILDLVVALQGGGPDATGALDVELAARHHRTATLDAVLAHQATRSTTHRKDLP